MEYEKVDEVARGQACERVKQIVKAIKTMKIKYYLDFSKISGKDKETYQKLEDALERVSSTHNLEGLKVALMSEVSARYDRGSSGDGEQWNLQEPEDILKKCYGVIDKMADALSRGKIRQAIVCQKILEQYKSQTTSQEIFGEIKDYKRRKLEELDRLRDQTELGKSTKEAKNEKEITEDEYIKKLGRMNKFKRAHVQGRYKCSELISDFVAEQEKAVVEIGGRD